MIKLKRLELNNVVYFNHVRLDIGASPLTIISGLNHDSLIAENTSNGAGKSLLWSTLPNLVYEATPLSGGKGRSQAKKAMLAKDSKIEVELVSGDDTYTITQQSSKVAISKNGVDAEIRLAKDQRERVAQIFPLSEEEFYSYVYIQSQRNLSFQVDRPAERLHYITDMFDLNVYDRLKAYFTAKLGEIKGKQVEEEVVSSSHLRTVQLLERLGWDKEQDIELDKASEFLEKNKTRLRKQQSIVEQIKTAEANRKTVAQAEAALAKIGKLPSAEWLKSAQEQVYAYQSYCDSKEDYEEQFQELESRIKKFGKVRDCSAEYDEVEAKVDSLEAELTELTAERNRSRDVQERRRELEEELKYLGGKPKRSVKQLQDDKRQCQNILEFEDLLHDCGSGTCPTCKQDVDVGRYRKQIERAKKQYVKIEPALKAWAVVEELAELKDVTFNEKSYQKKRKQYTELADRLDELGDMQDKYVELHHLRERQKGLRKPEQVKKPKYTLRQVEDFREDVAEKQRLESVLKVTKVQNVGDLEQERNKLTRMEEKYEQYQRTVIEGSSKRGEYRTLVKECRRLEKELEAIKPIIAQRDLFKSLEKAYSARGLKVNAANSVLLQIESNLNQYSNLIFAEPFKFNLRAERDGVHCEVDRGNGKVSDIRWLSGAESDCFRLLWMWVMLIMAEPAKRTNFAVLDEPDSHMDETTRSLFIERYLPALQTIVPNIYVITPLSKHHYPDCKYMTVVKKDGESRLVEDESDWLLLQSAGQGTGSSVEDGKSKKKRSGVRTRHTKKKS